MFSVVHVRGLECPQCHHVDDYFVQFKFGSCHLQTIEVGDSLAWGVYDRGEPGLPLVVTEGAGNPCNGCGGPHFSPEPGAVPEDVVDFDVFIENDVIVHVRWSTGEFPYWDDNVAAPDLYSFYIVLHERPSFLPH